MILRYNRVEIEKNEKKTEHGFCNDNDHWRTERIRYGQSEIKVATNTCDYYYDADILIIVFYGVNNVVVVMFSVNHIEVLRFDTWSTE